MSYCDAQARGRERHAAELEAFVRRGIFVQEARTRLRLSLHSFARDVRGNIAMLFALSCSAAFIAMGAGLDLSRAFSARQRLSEVAALTCQYSVRPSIVILGSSSSGGSRPASRRPFCE